MYDVVLWATDGSPEADIALGEAVRLVNPEGRLIAVHCDQRFMGARVAGTSVYPDEPERREHVTAQVDELRSRGIDVIEHIETTFADPAHMIAKLATQFGVDVIVCGTRALHGLPALLSGSVASHLLKHAEVPVIVVPAVADLREPAHA